MGTTPIHQEVSMVQFGRQLRRRGGAPALLIGVLVSAALLAGGLILAMTG